jgi:hypothetical protein
MKSPTGRKWKNPVKKAATAETLNTPGNFAQFTEAMRKMLKAKPEKKPVFRAPAAS